MKTYLEAYMVYKIMLDKNKFVYIIKRWQD